MINTLPCQNMFVNLIEDRGDTGRHQRNTDGMPTEQGKLKNNIFT
jgi:hypothetical protein